MSEGAQHEAALTKGSEGPGFEIDSAKAEGCGEGPNGHFGSATLGEGASAAQPAPPAVAGESSPSMRRRHTRSSFRLRWTAVDAAGEMCASLSRLTVIALFVIAFLFQPFQIPSGSMERTLLIGDFVLVNKQVFAPAGRWRWLLPYRDPVHGTLAVFHYPVNGAELLVKRIIGLPGDRLRLRDNTVVLNGVPLPEAYARYRAAGRSSFRDRFPNLQEADPTVEAGWWLELRSRIQKDELPVPDGRYLALGDNRNNSQDSRFWGFVPRVNIVGEPILVYFSIDRSGPSLRMRPERVLHLLH